jgi:hypothetical protein
MRGREDLPPKIDGQYSKEIECRYTFMRNTRARNAQA